MMKKFKLILAATTVLVGANVAEAGDAGDERASRTVNALTDPGALPSFGLLASQKAGRTTSRSQSSRDVKQDLLGSGKRELRKERSSRSVKDDYDADEGSVDLAAGAPKHIQRAYTLAERVLKSTRSAGLPLSTKYADDAKSFYTEMATFVTTATDMYYGAINNYNAGVRRYNIKMKKINKKARPLKKINFYQANPLFSAKDMRKKKNKSLAPIMSAVNKILEKPHHSELSLTKPRRINESAVFDRLNKAFDVVSQGISYVLSQKRKLDIKTKKLETKLKKK